MLGALYSGASGLRAHLVKLDVVGNNIANINTVGFKAGRVTFEESLARFLGGAQRPDDGIGGKNPSQIGTGTRVASIDNLFTQGGLDTTGIATDLAIQGDGFFVVEETGGAQYYTRAGMFRLDALGHLVTPDGLILQGRIADDEGRILSGAPIEDLILPINEKVPAKATTEAKFTCNLNMEENPLGSILNSRKMLAIASNSDNIDGLFANGSADVFLNLTAGNTLTVDDGLGNSVLYSYTGTDAGPAADDFNTLNDLVTEINNDFDAAGFNTLSAALNAQGAIVFSDLTGAAHNIDLISDNTTLDLAFESAVGTIDNTVPTTTSTDEFSHIATGSDLLTALRNSAGTSLGLTAGDTINVAGTDGGTSVTDTVNVMAAAAPGVDGNAGTLDDLCEELESDFSIATGRAYIDSQGMLVIEGDAGTDDELEVTLTETGNTVLTAVTGSLNRTQDATDIIHTTSFAVYDSLGDSHTVTITFQKDDITPNLWHWSASLDTGTVLGGYSGDVTFNSDGSLSSFTYTGGADAFSFNPGNGAVTPAEIRFNAGTVGGFDGITQLAGPTTTIMSYQNGYTMGELDNIAIDENGEIIGTFTNGVIRKLAEIPLATFANSAGLKKQGNSLWAESSNSGIPLMGTAGRTLAGTTISAGYLEHSNVDLANEFIEMIIAQRGFQANSRIITVGDGILGELAALKR